MEATRKVDLGGGATVGEVLDALPEGVREMAARKELSIMVNGADVSTRDGLSTNLQEGDEVVLLPFAHGGGPG